MRTVNFLSTKNALRLLLIPTSLVLLGPINSPAQQARPNWTCPDCNAPDPPPPDPGPSPSPPPNNCVTPPGLSNGGASYSYWAPNTKITVYVGSGFSLQEAADIQKALNAWASSPGMTGNNISFSAVTATDPGTNALNAIRFVNDPLASTQRVATTQDLTYLNAAGQNTNQIGGATVSVNKGFKYSGASGPTLQYSSVLPSADQFFTSAMEHEIGHALGLDHPPGVPTDTNGNPNWCKYTGGPSIMNGVCGTNDQGDGSAPGGKLPASITPCDQNAQNSNEAAGKSAGPTAGGGTGGGPGSGLGPGSGTCAGTPDNDTCVCSPTTGVYECSCQGSPIECSDGTAAECIGGNWDCGTVTTSQCDGSAPCQGAVCVGPNQWDTSGCSTSCTDICDPSCSSVYNPSDPSCSGGGSPGDPGGGNPGDPGGGNPGDPGSGDCTYPDDYCDDGSGDGGYYGLLRDLIPVGGVVLATALPLIGFRKRKRDEDSL